MAQKYASEYRSIIIKLIFGIHLEGPKCLKSFYENYEMLISYYLGWNKIDWPSVLV